MTGKMKVLLTYFWKSKIYFANCYHDSEGAYHTAVFHEVVSLVPDEI